MRQVLLAAMLALAALPRAFAGPVPPAGCPNCILNTSAAQNAQINIGTETVRGTLTASTGTFTYLYATNLSITNLAGNGAQLTNLNASALATGTVSTTVVAGNYQGITGVGHISSGTWNGAAVGTQWGGTGQNWSTVNANYFPYFTATGTMGVLAPSAGALVYTGSALAYQTAPALSGANFTTASVPLAALAAGTVPANVLISSNSLPNTIPGTFIVGNIAGGAAFLTAPMSISNLIPQTLPTSIAASSITPTGVTAGYCGGQGTYCQIEIGGDGRIYASNQYVGSGGGVSTGVVTTAALYGNGQSGSPVGVNSSSVAVLSGGYVLNSQLNPILFSVKASTGVNADITKMTALTTLTALTSITSAVTASSSFTVTSSLGILSPLFTATGTGFVGPGPGITNLTPANFSSGALALGVSISTANVSPGLNGASELVQLNGSGLVPDALLDASSVTLQGNAFNGANELVKLTGAGYYPALNGSLITNIVATSIAPTAVNPGSYGSGTQVGAFTVESDGRLTAASNVNISGAPGAFTVGGLLQAQSFAWGSNPLSTGTANGSLVLAPGATLTASGGVIAGGPAVDVRLYGAVCNGSHDDTSAIQTALNLFTNGNTGTASGTLLFPPGQCVISSSLYYAGAPSYALRFSGTIGGSNGGTGSSIYWNGAAGGTMMFLLGANNLTVDDMEWNLNNSAKYGVVVTATNQINTTLNNAIITTGVHTVAPASIVNIATGTILNIDTGANFELVTVTGIVASSFTATFAKTHSAGVSIGNSAGSSGVTFRRNSFLFSNGAGSAEVAVGNPSTVASNQVSELQFTNSNFFGGAGSVNGFVALSAGNTKNYNFSQCEFSNHQVHVNLAKASGVANFYGAIMGGSTVSDFVAGAAALTIDGAESEPASGSQFVTGTTGASPGELTVTGSVFAVAASTTNHDIILSYQGSVILRNNEFSNLRTSTAIPYIQIDDPLFYTGSNDGNTLISESNWYLNAPAGYAPFVDGNNTSPNTLLPTYYNHQPVNVVSRFDLGGPIGTVVKLYNYEPVYRVTSQTAQFVPGFGLLAAGTTDYAVVFRNDANSGDIVGLTKTHADVVMVGGTPGAGAQEWFWGTGAAISTGDASGDITLAASANITVPSGYVAAGNTQINTTGLSLGNTGNPAVQGLESSGNSVIQNCGSTGCFSKFSDSSGNLGLTIYPSLGTIIGSTAVFALDGATQPTIFPHAPLMVLDNFNGDMQAIFQNQSNGANATTNSIWFADNATNTNNFADAGVNGSGYSGAANGWFDGPDDGFFYCQGGNCSFGAAASGKHVNIFAGGTAQSNVVEVAYSTGVVVYGNLSVTGSINPSAVAISTANIGPGFNSANELVQLNGSGQLPAVSGALLTNLPGVSQIQSGSNGIVSVLDAAGNYLLYTSTNGAQSVTSSTGTVYVPAGGGIVNTYGIKTATFTATGAVTIGGANGIGLQNGICDGVVVSSQVFTNVNSSTLTIVGAYNRYTIIGNFIITGSNTSMFMTIGSSSTLNTWTQQTISSTQTVAGVGGTTATYFPMTYAGTFPAPTNLGGYEGGQQYLQYKAELSYDAGGLSYQIHSESDYTNRVNQQETAILSGLNASSTTEPIHFFFGTMTSAGLANNPGTNLMSGSVYLCAKPF